MESHYEINVSLRGVHFFATAPRSCRDKRATLAVLGELRRRFPAADGFDISVTYYQCAGYLLAPDEIEAFDPYADCD
jgi:hypothetical protein